MPVAGSGFSSRSDPGRYRGRRTVVLVAVAAVAGAITVVATGFLLIGRPADNSPLQQQRAAYSPHAPTRGSVANEIWATPGGPLTAEVVVFMPGQAQLSNSAKADLGSLLNEIKGWGPTPVTITIRGFGDSGGQAAANSELSRGRALAVAAFIKGQGVPASQLACLPALRRFPPMILCLPAACRRLPAARRRLPAARSSAPASSFQGRVPEET